MFYRLVGLPMFILFLGASEHVAACDLKLEPSPVFGGSCKVLVGYYDDKKVGPFHVNLPDGSIATAGTCEGYASVAKVEGNTVSIDAFHTVPARVYTLTNDCRSSSFKNQ